MGPDRRVAFRLTRVLLGGARAVGYSAAQLASCLDVSVDSVRNRGASDGWVTAGQVTLLTGIPPDELAQWHDAGAVTRRCRDDAGQDCYLASELIRRLAQARTRDAEFQFSGRQMTPGGDLADGRVVDRGAENVD